jgi:AcrR family transcriptional regulator
MKKTTPAPKSYHHGDLRNALLAEAERILETNGMPGLSLRAVARGVGVSHAAPSNHFDDLTGLLSELAADGHLRMDAELLEKAQAAGDDPAQRAIAMGRGYIAFAKAHPGLFTLMYRSERLDRQRPALKAALAKKRLLLRNLLGARSGNETRPPMIVAAQATALWALVHGYAVLMLDGALKGTLAALPESHTAESFVKLVLQSVALAQ